MQKRSFDKVQLLMAIQTFDKSETSGAHVNIIHGLIHDKPTAKIVEGAITVSGDKLASFPLTSGMGQGSLLLNVVLEVLEMGQVK